MTMDDVPGPVRALVQAPPSVARGQIVEIRATLRHAMETGYRRDAGGALLPRDIVRRFEARLAGELVFAADWFPAIAANPMLAFTLRAERSGPLVLHWRGDNGFEHTETVALVVT